MVSLGSLRSLGTEFPEEILVRKVGFEPTCLSAPPPQDGVSASSTTSAAEKIVAKAGCGVNGLGAKIVSPCKILAPPGGGPSTSLRTSLGARCPCPTQDRSSRRWKRFGEILRPETSGLRMTKGAKRYTAGDPSTSSLRLRSPRLRSGSPPFGKLRTFAPTGQTAQAGQLNPCPTQAKG